MNFRIQLPHERSLTCGSHRRRHPRTKASGVVLCEKPALHGFGCLLSESQAAWVSRSTAPYSLVRVIQQDTRRHAGRDRNGKWHFWEGEL